MLNTILHSPLEQFTIHPILLCYLDLTNETGILLTLCFFFYIFIASFGKLTGYEGLTVISSRLQAIISIIFKLALSLCVENIQSKRSELFLPFIFSIFTFIMLLNTIGLIPYSFTLTSHLAVTLTISLASFIGINIIAVQEKGWNFFALFLPGGTSVLLALLLVPIECISYIFKPISLSIRLFANMMAGHTLLKVIAGFAFTLLFSSSSLVVLHYIPVLILLPLFFLELAVALIQSFVFAVLICIYINDSVFASH